MSEQKYIQERERQAKKSTVTGVALTVVLHGLLVACCFVTGFTYLDPPPPEQEQILIDFTEPEIKEPEQVWNGTQPMVAEPDPTEPINLVQASEGPNEGTESNEAPESTVDDFGDVDIVEKPREKEINRKAFADWFNEEDEDGINSTPISHYITAYSLDGNRKYTARVVLAIIEDYDMMEDVKTLAKKLNQLAA